MIPGNFALSERERKGWDDILVIFSVILFIFSVSISKIVTIPYYLDFGLIEVLPLYFPVSIVILLIGILLQIEKMRDRKFIALLVLLSIYIWGIRVFVESYAFAHDAWGMGFIADEVIKAGGFSFDDQIRSGMYYIGWPGSFLFFTGLVNLSGIPTIDLLKLYPLISAPITFFCLYVLFKVLSRNELISRYAVLFFLLVNNFIYIHWSPQSLSFVLFISLIILLNILKKNNSVIINTLIFVIIFSIIFVHPTMSLILTIFLLSIYIVIKFKIYEKLYYEPFISPDLFKRLFLMTIVLFMAWNIYVADFNFSQLVQRIIPNLINVFSSEKTASFAVAKITNYSIATKIRSYFFLITGLITVYYLLLIYLKQKKIKTFETSFLILAAIFAIADINLYGGFMERAPMISYISISIIFGMLYNNLTDKKSLLKYTFIFFLLITFTFYDHDVLDLYSNNLIKGYGFALLNGYGEPVAISTDTIVFGEPFLIFNYTLLFGENAATKDINISVSPDDYYIILDSNNIKWSFKNTGQLEDYTDFLTHIDNNFFRIYENSATTVYLNPHYENIDNK